MIWTEESLAAAGLVGSVRRVPIPGKFQHVAGMLEPWLQTHDQRIALVGRNRRLSFAELDREAEAAACFLESLGVSTGVRVAASLANHPEIVIAFLAVQRLGAIWVGINLAYSPFEQAYMLEDSGASYLIAETSALVSLSAADKLPAGIKTIAVTRDDRCAWANGIRANLTDTAIVRDIDPWAPAAIAYTSGTTGRPKGTVHSQHNLIVAARVTELIAGYRADDAVRATASPLTILNMMIGGPLATLVAGNTQVCCDRIDVEGLAAWIRDERINTMALVPTTIRDLLTSDAVKPDDLASLRWVVIGAAMVPEGMTELYRDRFGHSPAIGYGLTEAPTVVSRTHPATPAIQGAIGRPVFHLEVGILDKKGVLLPHGAEGEICVRATRQGEWAHVYTPPLGYWGKPAETQQLLFGKWLHTGDLGSLDEDGELFIAARRSDLIVRGGANVYPAEVERVIRQHPHVADCAVIGESDERLGETVAAVIEGSPWLDYPALISEVREACEQQLARYKVPARWYLVERFPRNAMGKTVRADLRKQIEAAPVVVSGDNNAD